MLRYMCVQLIIWQIIQTIFTLIFLFVIWLKHMLQDLYSKVKIFDFGLDVVYFDQRSISKDLMQKPKNEAKKYISLAYFQTLVTQKRCSGTLGNWWHMFSEGSVKMSHFLFQSLPRTSYRKLLSLCHSHNPNWRYLSIHAIVFPWCF